jgi:hypothetical protein
MANDSQRDKARAIFGKTFFENSKALPNPKNAAAALQKRANDRPIPTYKVGGVVKKNTPPQPTAAEREADRKRREEYAKMKVTKEQGEAITRGNRAAAIEGGRYKDGGKIGKYKQGSAVATGSSGARSEPIQNLNYNLLSGSGSGGSGRSTATRITPTGISQPSSLTAAMAGQGPPKGYGFKVTRKFKKGGEAMAGAKRAVKAEQDFTGLMKEAAARAAAKGTPVMKDGGATNEYTAKRVMSRIKAGNFKDGGRAEYLRDRRMKDIEKDYKIALAKGKNEGVAKAKYEQRKADAADDYAKRTKADRTTTKASERAAEAALTEARRTKGESIKKRDMAAAAADINKYFAGKDMTPKAAETAKAAVPAAAKPEVKKTVAKAPAKRTATTRTEIRTATPAAAAPAAAAPAAAAKNNTAFGNIAVPSLLARNAFGDATAARLKKEEAERTAKATRDKAAAENRYQGRGRIAVQAPRPIQPVPKKVATTSTTKPITAEERKKRDAAYLAAIRGPEKFAAGGAGKVRKGMMKGK